MIFFARGDWQARTLRRRSDEVRGLVVSKLRSYLGTVDQRYQQVLTTTEASSTPRLNATLDSEGRTTSTQMLLHTRDDNCRSRVGRRCHNADVNEGVEAWRQFVME